MYAYSAARSVPVSRLSAALELGLWTVVTVLELGFCLWTVGTALELGLCLWTAGTVLELSLCLWTVGTALEPGVCLWTVGTALDEKVVELMNLLIVGCGRQGSGWEIG